MTPSISIIDIPILFILASCFGILFRVPPKYLLIAVCIGAMNGALLNTLPKFIHTAYATFLISLLSGSISHLVARKTRMPAQVFLVPGVILLVPGTYLYRGFTNMLIQDYHLAALNLGIAAAITFAISFGLLLANWLVPSRQEL